jgi:hypothetical protein
MTKLINKVEAVEILKSINDGTIFTVTFVKRTTGEVRTMNCRRGVTKYTKGGTLGYDATKKNLLSVYDVKSEGYRMINLDDVREVKANGKVFSVA